METIYTGACSAALNGNVGVPAVSFRMPCVSSQLVLLFLFFPSFLFFPPPSLPFQGTSGISYTSVEGSFAICEQLSSFTLPWPLYCELHKYLFSCFCWGGGEDSLLWPVSILTPFPLVVHVRWWANSAICQNKRARHMRLCFTTTLSLKSSLSHS